MNENNISGTLESVVINGSVFKIGGTNTPSEGIGFEDQIEALNNSITAAKTAISTPSGEKYLNITKNTESDGHDVYNIGTRGIDDAINTAIDTALSGNQSILETLNNITQWIENDATGTAAIIEALASKADKVSNATSGNFASIDANGNLLDSGVSAASFQVAGNYKTTQTVVSDPAANGTSISFIASIQQDSNGSITATKKTVQTATDQQDGLMSAQDHSRLSNLVNQSVAYGDVSYSVQTSNNISGAVTIDGSKPVHVVTLTGNVSSVTLSTQPEEGHSTHVFFYSDANRTITIQHDSSSAICPSGSNISFTVPAGGYVEVDFLRANNKLYVRGV